MTDRYLWLNSGSAVDALRELLRPIAVGRLIVEPIDGGWRITQTERHYLDVMKMMFNWRLAETPIDMPMVYDRYWCYQGTGSKAFTAAVTAAAMWDGAADTEPLGWNKNGQTQQWRKPGTEGTSLPWS